MRTSPLPLPSRRTAPSSDQQRYENHRRVFPLYHVFALPVVVVNVGVALGRLLRHPTPFDLWNVVFSAGVVAGFLACRASTLTVQNRLIGLEMRLRLTAVLPPELRARIPELCLRHLVALRFAGDAELPGLVERCLRGEFANADAVKREIREWRGDFVRA